MQKTRRRPDEADRRIGARIKALRGAKKWSQQKLADALGVTFQQVQKYESGGNRVTLSTAMTIAALLEAPITALCDPAEGAPGNTVDKVAGLCARPNVPRILRALERIDNPALIAAIAEMVESVRAMDRTAEPPAARAA